MKNEKLSAKFHRKIIKADFRPNESVQSSAFRGVQYVKPRDYVNSGKVARLFERVWYTFVLLLFAFTVVVITTGAGVIIDRLMEMKPLQAILMGAGIFGIWLFGIYMTLLSQAYLRWMYRNRNR